MLKGEMKTFWAGFSASNFDSSLMVKASLAAESAEKGEIVVGKFGKPGALLGAVDGGICCPKTQLASKSKTNEIKLFILIYSCTMYKTV